MRPLLLVSLLCTLSFVTAMGAVHALQVIVSQRTPANPSAPAAWVVRIPAQYLPFKGGATLLISVRDACAFISVGNYRRELRANLSLVQARGPAPVTACTPYFPKGSPRR